MIITKKRLFSLSAVLSTLILALIYSQIYNQTKEFTYLQPADLPARYGALYFAGQPDARGLKTLEEKGFAVIINIRGPEEMTFDEKAVAERNGLIYYNLPLLKDGRIMDSAVTEILAAIQDNRNKKILLHCTSGNRVASWFGATLVRDMGYSRQDAVKMSRKAGMTRYDTERSLRDYLNNLAR